MVAAFHIVYRQRDKTTCQCYMEHIEVAWWQVFIGFAKTGIDPYANITDQYVSMYQWYVAHTKVAWWQALVWFTGKDAPPRPMVHITYRVAGFPKVCKDKDATIYQ